MVDKEEELAELRHNRGILKGHVTRLNTFLNKVENQNKFQDIQKRLSKIERYFDQFDEVQTRLEFLDADEISKRETIEDSFYDLISKCNDILNSQLSPNISLVSNVNSQSHSNDPLADLKLPPIKLPEFSGEYSNWAAFHDAFLHLIHNNARLTNVQRICHLKSCLKGSALKHIQNLNNTDINYDVAWQILLERYENKRITVNEHISIILNFPKITKNSNATLRDLTDQIHQHVTALEKLGVSISGWEVVLISIVTSKLENSLNLEWEDTLTANELPTYENFRKFLTRKCSSHENVFKIQDQRAPTHSKIQTKNYSQNYAVTEVQTSINNIICQICKESHYIYQCPKLLNLNLQERYAEIRKHNLCTNCLRAGHNKFNCRSRRCKKCNSNHNTLLHNDFYQSRQTYNSQSQGQHSVGQNNQPRTQIHAITIPNNENQIKQTDTRPSSQPNTQRTPPDSQVCLQIVQGAHNNSKHDSHFNMVLLSTAEILIHDNFGNVHKCRALLDSGSQSSLITKDLCEKLNLNCDKINIPIAGVNQNIVNILEKTHATISSRYNQFQTDLTFLVLKTITEKIPPFTFDNTNLELPIDIQISNLADPQYNQSRHIDILLGADIFYELLLPNKIKLGKSLPVLQETVFGYIFTGMIDTRFNKRIISCNYLKISNETLNENLAKFWELEEIQNKPIPSPEAEYCENYFRETTTRAQDGKFIVKLPFKIPNLEYGNSKSIAIKRFNYLENKLNQNNELKTEYFKFMKEYYDLEHMSLVDLGKITETSSYILPHHSVIKKSSTTTKCRVVFDGSARTNLGISLNDNLHIGYQVQDDLFAIILRFRLRKYVLNADIKMMFRQIWVHSDHRKFQQILWRFNETESLKLYTLDTVTYGTACAPFIAQRTLLEIANQNEIEYPRTSKIIKNSFYMDDLLVSVDTKADALDIYYEMSQILQNYGFSLRKWSSNDLDILNSILNKNDNTDKFVEFHEDKDLKTLGIVWHPDKDIFNYSVNLEINHAQIITKRLVLAVVSKIFDPLGLIGPAVISAKLFIQHLWRQGLDWDEPLPKDLCIWFQTYVIQLQGINDIIISRYISCITPRKIELHCFCDASEKAYGSCIYLVSEDQDGQLYSNLLCAKSKVAPQKMCTLPRLELLAAYLLAQLVDKIKRTLDVDIRDIFYYTDSTIVLSWLRVEPSRLKTFVANRVSKITNLTNINRWRHVNSDNNAADVISRGVESNKLKDLKIWWQGPEFLINKSLKPSTCNIPLLTELPDIKSDNLTVIAMVQPENLDIFDRYSNFEKLKRVVAYCLRFKEITLKKRKFNSTLLSIEELEYAKFNLIKLAQTQVFSKEIKYLKINKHLTNSSDILSLSPFLDEMGILRVGGRLRNSNLTFENKHPIILPKKHPLTTLIIRHFHHKYLHAGAQNLLSIIRLEFWPINGKITIKQIIRTCVKCFRVNPKPSNTMMGDLPHTRVTPARPFFMTGVDYAGPILIKAGAIRKPITVKTYICIFVCLATRAVHIDLAIDLSTTSFINVLKRFVSRRGKPSEIHSDNGSNFIGANNYFVELYNLFHNTEHNIRVTQHLASDNIKFKRIPPHSPHMGGIWEAAVKSAKFHLKRNVGNVLLNYEEMYTILTQVEACMNSRPLSPISNDPNDYIPLTPAHFLIGTSLAAVPEPNVQDIPLNRLKRYQLLSQLYQNFWSRWSREYLTELQRKSKWSNHPKVVPKEGDLVLLVEDNMPPLRWPIGRIIQLHPGADKMIRVVSVRISSGSVFKRTINKICILPNSEVNN